MFVADGARERLRELRRGAFFTDHVDAVLAEARMLGISPDEVVRYIHQRGADA